jgi:hypothetical protein
MKDMIKTSLAAAGALGLAAPVLAVAQTREQIGRKAS